MQWMVLSSVVVSVEVGATAGVEAEVGVGVEAEVSAYHYLLLATRIDTCRGLHLLPVQAIALEPEVYLLIGWRLTRKRYQGIYN